MHRSAKNIDEVTEQVISKSGFLFSCFFGQDGIDTFVFVFDCMSEHMTGWTFCASVAVV